MAEVLLFHHAQGHTAGIAALAEELRAAGHTVHDPDLYEGRVFEELEAGLAHAKGIGFGTLLERGVRAAEGLPAGVVYLGFSLGVMPAQKLAQTRPGAAGAVLVASCVPTEEFGTGWPAGVPVQVHGKDADENFVDGGDLDAARELLAAVGEPEAGRPGGAELFLYPGKQHLFTDSSLSDHDPAAARLFAERLAAFLERI
jgi:dienelactone hydrolase